MELALVEAEETQLGVVNIDREALCGGLGVLRHWRVSRATSADDGEYS